jgi:hypothetical protein
MKTEEQLKELARQKYIEIITVYAEKPSEACCPPGCCS